MTAAMLERSLFSASTGVTDWRAIAQQYAEACRTAERERAAAVADLQTIHAFLNEPGFVHLVLSIDQHDILQFALLDVIRHERSAINSEAIPGEPVPENAEDLIRQYGMLFNALFPRTPKGARE